MTKPSITANITLPPKQNILIPNTFAPDLRQNLVIPAKAGPQSYKYPEPIYSVKNKSIQQSLRVVLVFYLLAVATPAHAQYQSGSGDPNNPFLIKTPQQLNNIGLHPEHFNKHFKLIADIDLAQYTGEQFNLIGNDDEYLDPNTAPFSGVFDGNHHTISNFHYKSTFPQTVGLFAFVTGESALIQNLTLKDPNTQSETNSYLGALVGLNKLATILNCRVEGGFINGPGKVGGLICGNTGIIKNCFTNTNVSGCVAGGLVAWNAGGEIYACISQGYTLGLPQLVPSHQPMASGGIVGLINTGMISFCHARGNVEGDWHVGGLAGLMIGSRPLTINSTVTHCSATGNVFGNDKVGGLVGSAVRESTSIDYSFATGNVSGLSNIGGLVGEGSSNIHHCYATGNVTGNKSVGGLIGDNSVSRYPLGSTSYCYARGRVTGNYSSGGLIGRNSGMFWLSYWDTQTTLQNQSPGGKGRTTAQMKQAQTYQGWGFDAAWTIDENNDYPHLAWENQPGSIITQSLPVYAGGSGDPDDPFKIATPEQLNTLGVCQPHWNKHFEMISDIDLSQYYNNDFNIIGFPFTGSFNGLNHTIHNFTYTAYGESYVGLFGKTDGPGAVIQNLSLCDPNI